MSKKNKSWLMKSIWLITIVPLVIAYFMAYTGYGLPGGTKNNGILLPSGIIVPDDLVKAQDDRWGLLVVSDQCNDLCQQQVYKLQQLFISMAKHEERLHAIWLSNSEKVAAGELTVDVDFNKVQQLNDKALFNWFNLQDLPWQDQSILLVDPNGVLVLRFTPELSGRKIMSDIKWLLKASRVG